MPSEEFMKLEYAAILDKMGSTREDIRRTESVYPLASVGLYAWLLTHPYLIGWWWRLGMCLPAAISLLGIVRLRGRLKSMRLLEDYCQRIEAEFYGQSSWGWERTYAKHRPMLGVGLLRWLVGVSFVLCTVGLAVWACASPAPSASLKPPCAQPFSRDS